jgi:hypothetical protein
MNKSFLSAVGVLFVLCLAGFESALFSGSFNGVV